MTDEEADALDELNKSRSLP